MSFQFRALAKGMRCPVILPGGKRTRCEICQLEQGMNHGCSTARLVRPATSQYGFVFGRFISHAGCTFGLGFQMMSTLSA